jgi:hypothetical protein
VLSSGICYFAPEEKATIVIFMYIRHAKNIFVDIGVRARVRFLLLKCTFCKMFHVIDAPKLVHVLRNVQVSIRLLAVWRWRGFLILVSRSMFSPSYLLQKTKMNKRTK